MVIEVSLPDGGFGAAEILGEQKANCQAIFLKQPSPPHPGLVRLGACPHGVVASAREKGRVASPPRYNINYVGSF
jgi:hypothetical protein